MITTYDSQKRRALWWAHVSNSEVLQRSGLSAIGDILRHRRLSLFGHVARLDHGVPAHEALRLMVGSYEDRKPMASWRGPPGRPHNIWLNKVQKDANALPLSTLRRSEIATGHGAAQRSGVHSDYATMMMTMISGRPTQSTFRFVHDRYSERVSGTGEVGKGLRKKRRSRPR